jgi:hypothetical protein
MPPPPHRHLGNAEKASRRAIAAEDHFEKTIVPTAERPAFKARSRYRMETVLQRGPKAWVACPFQQKAKRLFGARRERFYSLAHLSGSEFLTQLRLYLYVVSRHATAHRAAYRRALGRGPQKTR